MKDKDLVIMIDDDQEDQEIFYFALSQLERPIKFLTFFDCEHAVAHFQNTDVNTPAFVFLDLNLPRINGDECLVGLKKLKEFDHPCIIIYSTSIPPDWQGKLEEIGVNKFLNKSCSTQLLMEQLKVLTSS